METMQSLKRRVHTAEDLHSLVRTMKALAAVNIRLLERAVESLATYRRTIELGLRAVLRQRDRSTVTTQIASQQNLGAIVFGSDQGMCGQLNDQIVRCALEHIHRLSITPDRRVTLAVGARAASRLEDAGERLDATLPVAGSPSGITRLVQDILLQVDRWRTEQGIERIVVYYCNHVGRAAYSPSVLELLPMDRLWLANLQRQAWPTRMLPMFTMDAEGLFSELVRQYLFVSLFRAGAESMASENASRLASMRGAERNISDRIVELTGLFHQTRQMAITEELLDIVSGFEALSESP